jgi:hypothetical protein
MNAHRGRDSLLSTQSVTYAGSEDKQRHGKCDAVLNGPVTWPRIDLGQARGSSLKVRPRLIAPQSCDPSISFSGFMS